MTESNEDFVSFEKALRDLKLQSEQLKKMVSQGEIRAFRVGDSMQFRVEDVEAIRLAGDDDELVFADALEDDTGMKTEELSEEDTLLVEDDVDDEEELAVVETTPRGARSRRESMAAQSTEKAEHPIWVAAAILCFLALVWGAMVSWDISAGSSPEDSLLTKMWSTK